LIKTEYSFERTATYHKPTIYHQGTKPRVSSSLSLLSTIHNDITLRRQAAVFNPQSEDQASSHSQQSSSPCCTYHTNPNTHSSADKVWAASLEQHSALLMVTRMLLLLFPHVAPRRQHPQLEVLVRDVAVEIVEVAKAVQVVG
jgi:hypothetical protein